MNRQETVNELRVSGHYPHFEQVVDDYISKWLESLKAVQGGDAEVRNDRTYINEPYMQQSRHDDGRMTREQAVKWVKFVHDVLYGDKDEEIREALNMAIEALQIEISEDAISRDAAINLVNEYQRSFIYESDADELLVELETLPSVTPTEQNEEDILKFYYVESLDEYWIGQRSGTRYYGKWTGNCFTFTHSRYLPWGEHVVAPDTLWKEHTYPSEPKEIPFNEWLQGFLRKERQNDR